MTSKRGLSQVVFGFLPDQTVDLEAGVWKVTEWAQPKGVQVEETTLREELARAASPWIRKDADNGFDEQLRMGGAISVVSPSEYGGVLRRRFPENFYCRNCRRLERSPDGRRCACGATAWIQLPFVAYHRCGRMESPWVRPCQAHREVEVILAKSATARDIRFQCPICKTNLGGFPNLTCDCAYGGLLSYTIHRAAVVYTPRSLVVVNPPKPEFARTLRTPGGLKSALEWVLDGMQARGPLEVAPTLETLTATFVTQGFDEATASAMAQAAAASSGGKVQAHRSDGADLVDQQLADAEREALRMAFATAGGRTRLADLAATADAVSEGRYRLLYQPSVKRLKLDEVELLENFPILTGIFGYTRGDASPGESTLRWFKSPSGEPLVHGFKADTEGLLFRLDPLSVGSWLSRRGFPIQHEGTPREARLDILRKCQAPFPGEVVDGTPGVALMTLVHSLSHRVIRRISSLAGIERDALGEYLVPIHLGFVVFAASRGDFVLGGLQALFEHDLDKALDEVVSGERRCPLDPGCGRHGGACVACLHLGEPSCRYYNGFLDRRALFGDQGYLSA